MRRQVNMAQKVYLSIRYGHRDRSEYNHIKKKMKKQLREATEERQDKFVQDVRDLLIRSHMPVTF